MIPRRIWTHVCIRNIWFRYVFCTLNHCEPSGEVDMSDVRGRRELMWAEW